MTPVNRIKVVLGRPPFYADPMVTSSMKAVLSPPLGSRQTNYTVCVPAVTCRARVVEIQFMVPPGLIVPTTVPSTSTATVWELAWKFFR